MMETYDSKGPIRDLPSEKRASRYNSFKRWVAPVLIGASIMLMPTSSVAKTEDTVSMQRSSQNQRELIYSKYLYSLNNFEKYVDVLLKSPSFKEFRSEIFLEFDRRGGFKYLEMLARKDGGYNEKTSNEVRDHMLIPIYRRVLLGDLVDAIPKLKKSSNKTAQELGDLLEAYMESNISRSVFLKKMSVLARKLTKEAPDLITSYRDLLNPTILIHRENAAKHVGGIFLNMARSYIEYYSLSPVAQRILKHNIETAESLENDASRLEQQANEKRREARDLRKKARRSKGSDAKRLREKARQLDREAKRLKGEAKKLRKKASKLRGTSFKVNRKVSKVIKKVVDATVPKSVPREKREKIVDKRYNEMRSRHILESSLSTHRLKRPKPPLVISTKWLKSQLSELYVSIDRITGKLNALAKADPRYRPQTDSHIRRLNLLRKTLNNLYEIVTKHLPRVGREKRPALRKEISEVMLDLMLKLDTYEMNLDKLLDKYSRGEDIREDLDGMRSPLDSRESRPAPVIDSKKPVSRPESRVLDKPSEKRGVKPKETHREVVSPRRNASEVKSEVSKRRSDSVKDRRDGVKDSTPVVEVSQDSQERVLLDSSEVVTRSPVITQMDVRKPVQTKPLQPKHEGIVYFGMGSGEGHSFNGNEMPGHLTGSGSLNIGYLSSSSLGVAVGVLANYYDGEIHNDGIYDVNWYLYGVQLGLLGRYHDGFLNMRLGYATNIGMPVFPVGIDYVGPGKVVSVTGVYSAQNDWVDGVAFGGHGYFYGSDYHVYLSGEFRPLKAGDLGMLMGSVDLKLLEFLGMSGNGFIVGDPDSLRGMIAGGPSLVVGPMWLTPMIGVGFNDDSREKLYGGSLGLKKDSVYFNVMVMVNKEGRVEYILPGLAFSR